MSFTLISVLTALILLFYGVRSGRELWITWPSNSEVQFVWQEALTDIGRHADNNQSVNQISIAGWSPDTMDDPTLELVLQDDLIARRHFGRVGEIQTLIIPNSANSRYAIYRPNDLPLHPSLEALLTDGYKVTVADQFTVYTAESAADFNLTRSESLFTDPASTNQLGFLGYRFIETQNPSQIELLSFWEVGAFPNRAKPNTKLFLHLVDSDGNLLAQHDSLDAPHRFWQTGDQIVQFHSLENIAGAAELRIGVYVGVEPWPRFQLADGLDFLTMPLDVR